MTIKLILANTTLFFLYQVIFAVSRYTNTEEIAELSLRNMVALNTQLSALIYCPWTIVTSLFSHFDLFHFLFNLLFLYFSGVIFESIFGSKKLLVVYILGGVFGNILEVLAHLNQIENSYVLGASGSIMAIFSAIAFYRPKTPVMLFGLISVPIIILALFFWVKDLIYIGTDDGVAHFAHLGGVVGGYLAVRNQTSSKNIVNWILNLFKPKEKKAQSRRPKTDEDYLSEKKVKQERIDSILDKIAKGGYDSLSKDEKDFLFKQSDDGKTK